MGIKNFLPMLRRFAPNSASNWIHLRSFENDRVAVDASCYVYQALYSLDTEKPYLTGIYNFAKNLLALNLKPIFVFDSISKRNPNKRLEAIKRYQRKSLDALRVTRYEKREKRMEKFLEIIGDLALLSKNEFAITINHAMKNENIKKNFKLINFNLNKIKTDSDAEFFKLQNKSSEKEEVLIKNNIAENLAQYSDQLLETFSEETLPKPEINNLKYEFDLLNEVLQKKKVDAKDMENVETTKKIFSVELKTLKSRTARIKKDMILELMEMLQLMGVPCIVSDGDYEAESVCSTMTVEKITVATLTEDTDCVIFGDGQVLTKIFKSPDTNNIFNVLMLDPVLIRKELSFTKEQFTDLSILMGCDFSGTLQKVGHVTGVKLIKEHKNIEAILALNKYKHGPDFNYVEAREVFKNTFKIPEVWRDENFWEHLESKKNSTLLQKFLVEHNVKNNGLEMSYMLESFLEDSDG